MVDRFGAMPVEVANLLKIVAIKRLCRAAGVEKVDAGHKGAILAFRNNAFRNPAGLVSLMQKQAGTVQLWPAHKPIYRRPGAKPEQREVGLQRAAPERGAGGS